MTVCQEHRFDNPENCNTFEKTGKDVASPKIRRETNAASQLSPSYPHCRAILRDHLEPSPVGETSLETFLETLLTRAAAS